MLSSVAERVYWLARYLERTEDTARLLLVRHYSVLDMPRALQPGWSQLLDVLGAQEDFSQRGYAANEKNIVAYVFADRSSSSSILSSLTSARENMRTTREILPSEAWERVNSLYLSVARRANKGLPRNSRHGVLSNIISACQQLTGMLSGTMNQDEAYQFVRLGRNLERTDMTTRIIDVGTADLIKAGEEALPYQNTLWISVLQSMSAYQMYRRSVQSNVRPPEVVNFLLSSHDFPRAVYRNLLEVEAGMKLLPGGEPALKVARSVQRKLRRTDCKALQGAPLHAFIDDMQLRLEKIHQAIAATWFRPE